MSRLCRLRNKSHGEDGQWAYEEIATLRQRVQELEKERDKVTQYWQIAEGRCDALKQQRDELEAVLRECRDVIEEAQTYCEGPQWSPSMAHDCGEAIAKIDEVLHVKE